MPSWILFSVIVATLVRSNVFSQVPLNGLSYDDEDLKQVSRNQISFNLQDSSNEDLQKWKGYEMDYWFKSPVLSRQARNAPGQYEKFYEFLIGKGLKKFCKYLRSARLEDVLSSTGTFTVFAPNDKAFTFIPGGTLEQIANNPEKLREFILYHIVPGSLGSSSIRNDVTQNTVQGTPIRLNNYGQETAVNGAQILEPDGHYNRDIVHVIDRVLYPLPSMDLVGQTKWTQVELYGLIVLAGLDKQLSDGSSYTIFAPADEAFQNLPPVVSDILKSNVTLLRQVLLNHVLKGTYYRTALNDGLTLTSVGGAPLTFSDRRGLLLVNGIPVVEPNFMVLNGVIHVINRVLLPKQVLKDCQCLPEVTQQLDNPPPGVTGGFQTSFPVRQPSLPLRGSSPPGLVTGGGAPPPTGNTIFQIIEMPGLNVQGQPVGLTIFYDLLLQSGVDLLKQPGPFTVLVPTDDAFSNLPAGVLNELKNNPQLLRRVLLNHIISLSLNPQDLQNNMVIETNSGLRLFVSVLNGGQKILFGGSKVLASTKAQNGYIYVINHVLYPLPVKNIAAVVRSRPNLIQLVSLIEESGLEDTLGGEKPYTLFAPTDEAFSAIPENVLQDLLSNPVALREFILNHVLEGVHYLKEFTSGLSLPTPQGQQLHFSLAPDGSVKVNGANIVEYNILTENGVVHIIDRVLFTPPLSGGQPQRPFRPGAPGTPIGGQPQRPSISNRPGQPVGASRGSDSIMPPYHPPPITTPQPDGQEPILPPPPGLVTGSGAPPPPGNTILQIIEMPSLNIQGQPVGLTTFYDLLKNSGLINTLNKQGPFTVLVPTDDAFSNLPAGVLNELKNNPQLLRRVLLNHVLSLSLNPQDLQNNMVIETNSGLRLFVSVLNGGQKILIGGPKLVASTLTENGYVYIINRFLNRLPAVNIVTELNSRENLAKLVSSVVTAGLEQTFRHEGPYTVFAPTDEAFAALPENDLRQLLGNPEALKEVILNHVVEGVHYKKEFSSGLVLPTPRGQNLRFVVASDGTITVNNARVVESDILTGNGVIHVIDRVLVTSSEVDVFSNRFPGEPASGHQVKPNIAELARGMGVDTFFSWLTETGLDNVIQDGGQYTVFAPTDEAVASLPASVQSSIRDNPDRLRPLLKYHISTVQLKPQDIQNEQTVPTLAQGKNIRFNYYRNGSLLTVSGASTGNLRQSGNVAVFVVNRVLYSPQGDLYSTVSSSPILKELTRFIKLAGLEELLKGPGPYTLFAPSKAAIANLSQQEYQQLLNDPSKLRSLLLRHLVKGTFFTSGLTHGLNLKADSGDDLTIKFKPDCIAVDGINIEYSDITASNGVIHVIDHFL